MAWILNYKFVQKDKLEYGDRERTETEKYLL